MSATTRTRVSRRATGAVAAVLLAMIVPAAVPATAAASSAEHSVSAAAAHKAASPVGKWDVVITIHAQDPPLYSWIICDVTADQRIRCVNKPGSATPPLEGTGIWKQGPGKTFSFWITHHAHRDESGNEHGSINAVHVGSFNKKSFTTNGTAFIDMEDGTPWTGPIAVESKATRIG
ncbi:hypothetical protein [Streptomyces sp. NPDC127084]|uniref:hypothetical protein n=1 Tax=Streptomyces sp. NPDC127084 TaxID=3347133 RepID=UPI00364741B6